MYYLCLVSAKLIWYADVGVNVRLSMMICIDRKLARCSHPRCCHKCTKLWCRCLMKSSGELLLFRDQRAGKSSGYSVILKSCVIISNVAQQPGWLRLFSPLNLGFQFQSVLMLEALPHCNFMFIMIGAVKFTSIRKLWRIKIYSTVCQNLHG